MTHTHIWMNHYLPMIPGLHPFKLDCRDVLGFFLAEQGSCASKGINSQRSSTSPPLFHKKKGFNDDHPGGPWCDHSADDDHPDQLGERCLAQNLVHEVHRHLPLCLLLYGLRGVDWICLCWVSHSACMVNIDIDMNIWPGTQTKESNWEKIATWPCRGWWRRRGLRWEWWIMTVMITVSVSDGQAPWDAAAWGTLAKLQQRPIAQLAHPQGWTLSGGEACLFVFLSLFVQLPPSSKSCTRREAAS